jgi:hypothetical protein
MDTIVLARPGAAIAAKLQPLAPSNHDGIVASR